jgi:hypothetical protein
MTSVNLKYGLTSALTTELDCSKTVLRSFLVTRFKLIGLQFEMVGYHIRKIL